MIKAHFLGDFFKLVVFVSEKVIRLIDFTAFFYNIGTAAAFAVPEDINLVSH